MGNGVVVNGVMVNGVMVNGVWGMVHRQWGIENKE
jgi:hypothetical protein